MVITILHILRYVPPLQGMRAERWGLSPPRGTSVAPSQSLHFVVIQAPAKLRGKYMLVAKASLLFTKAFAIDEKCLF